jgi:Outer membrane protein beta-barrel domain
MRKYIPIVCMMALFSGHSMSQTTWLGLKGGLSIPDLSGGGGNPLSENFTSRLALNFGVLSDFKVHNNFSLQVELNYAGQGGKRDGMQPITNLPAGLGQGPGAPPQTYLYANFKNKAVLDYLELPIMAKLSWGKILGWYVNAGPYLGYLLNAAEKTSGTSLIYEDPQGKYPLTDQGYPVPAQNFNANTNVTSSIRRFNVGVTGGGGVDWKVDPKDKIFFDARFEYGFINIQKYSEDGKNNTGNVLLSLGYAHRLGR